MSPFAAIGLALALWWAGTAATFLAARAGPPGPLRAMAAGAVGLGGLGAIAWGADGASALHVVAGFVGAIAVWGWHEFAFLSGWITGPNRRPAPPGLAGWQRFRAGLGAVAWHDLALVATLPLVWALERDAALPVGLWTYGTLLAARISAQVNLFAGVPAFDRGLVPERLAHLKSHFRTAPAGPLFAIAITGLTLAVGCFAEQAVRADEPARMVAFTLLATLAGLAMVEHWFFVLRFRDSALWRWLAPLPPARPRVTRTPADPA